MRLIFVTGTGTSIGKTIVTAAIAALAARDGRSTAVVKPIQTGVLPDEPADIDEVRRLAGIESVFELVRYSEPLAPATAARRRGEVGPSAAWLADGILDRVSGRDVVVIEGAGGALVRFNQAGETVIDLAHELAAKAPAAAREIVLASSSALGTLHASAATSEALTRRGLAVDHLVVSDWPGTGALLADRCNLSDLPDYCGAPLHGIVPMGAGLLGPSAFPLVAVSSLTRHLGGCLDPAGFMP